MTDSKRKYDDDEKARGLDGDNVPDESGAAWHTDADTGLGLGYHGEQAQVFPGEDGDIAATAKALNDAAAELGVTHHVQWQGDHFLVPLEVADKAKLPKGDESVNVPQQGAVYATPTMVRTQDGDADEVEGSRAQPTKAPARSRGRQATGAKAGAHSGDDDGTDDD